MAAPEEINADMLAFWNGKGGHTWVARQEHTDITLTPVTDALVGFAHHGPASGWWISAAVAARPRWSLRALSVRPAAWWDSTFPGRCWLRVRGAPMLPASPMSIGGRSILPPPRWMSTIC